jgi:hypothetical protein
LDFFISIADDLLISIVIWFLFGLFVFKCHHY